MHLTGKEKYRLKLKGWKKIFQTNRDPKQVGVVITVKGDLRLKLVRRHNEGHKRNNSSRGNSS
jgi:ketosteroid isomerase-like protein